MTGKTWINISGLSEAVRLAPSASNKQPWRVVYKSENKSFDFYLDEDFTYNNRFKDVKIQNVDLGIAMCHFESVSNELGLKGKWDISLKENKFDNHIYIASWFQG